MKWLEQLAGTQPVAHAVLVLALVAATGLLLGGLRLRELRLGTAGVLFAGILAGHLGLPPDRRILDFVREFGLILFVFTLGLQLGPGFFASLRHQGFRLNLLAAAIVLLGAGGTVLLARLLGIDLAAALGLFSGATTNTPSLGAAQQALATLPNVTAEQRSLPALAYAVSYPLGIVGILGSLVLLRKILRIDPAAEAEALRAARPAGREPLERVNLRVENPNLAGLRVADLPARHEARVVISRWQAAGTEEVKPATPDTVLHLGDTLLAVGTAAGLRTLRLVVGAVADRDLAQSPGPLTSRRVVVTRQAAVGKTLAELGLDPLHGVAVTRVLRADLQLTAQPELTLLFGDVLQIVGDAAGLRKAEALVGNQVSALNETQFVPIFLGLALGVAAGLVPLSVPGLPAPVRLGLAGGPLLLALLIGRLGHLGPLVPHMPGVANLAFRELGLTLFLASVGLHAGTDFAALALSARGALWAAAALPITVMPLLAVGLAARRWWRINF
ncbi:MAG: putative transporter, partial [Verrucomicrobiota bacterium]